jgi:hypothetical protein
MTLDYENRGARPPRGSLRQAHPRDDGEGIDRLLRAARHVRQARDHPDVHQGRAEAVCRRSRMTSRDGPAGRPPRPARHRARRQALLGADVGARGDRQRLRRDHRQLHRPRGDQLANVLNNPLDLPLIVKEQYEVGPSLAEDAISSGVKASIIGTALVAAFMITFTRRAASSPSSRWRSTSPSSSASWPASAPR